MFDPACGVPSRIDQHRSAHTVLVED